MRKRVCEATLFAATLRPFCSVSRAPAVSLFYNDVYQVTLPPQHRFPMHKYQAVRAKVESTLREKELSEHVRFEVSPRATEAELSSTHCPEYIRRFMSGSMTDSENRRIGFPWSIGGTQRITSSVGGTVAAMRSVCSGESISAAHLAGGTHHAFHDRGEGFCVFSDIAVAANLAISEFGMSQILIIDLDVHQGNGNAVLFQNNPSVFTFSMHCKSNYFSAIENSDLDIELEQGICDEIYMRNLNGALPSLLDAVRPKLVFYQGGVDIMRQDRFGKLRISAEGVSQRNKFVYRACHDRGILTVATMGGGYPKDLELTSPAFQNVVQAHAQGVNNAYFLSFPAQYLLPPCTVYLDLVETVC